MTNIDRAAEVLWLLEPHLSTSECDDQARELAQALADAGLLASDLPEPTVKDDGWAEWGGEVEFHPAEGLWSYDNGAMTLDSPDRLREVALIYLAAAKYAEENK